MLGAVDTVTKQMPDAWPTSILFCSFPLQQGADPSLIKNLCLLSQRMRGVAIREVDQAHPCFGTGFSRGLFATAAFEPGALLGRYAGQLRTATAHSECPRASGLFAISLDTSRALPTVLPAVCRPRLELDAELVGNEGRFINDYRNICAEPNVQFRTSTDASVAVWVDIFAMSPIQAGDEILVDYGTDFRDLHRRRSSPTRHKRYKRPRGFETPQAKPQEVCGRDGCRLPTPGGIPHKGLCEATIMPSLRRRKRQI